MTAAPPTPPPPPVRDDASGAVDILDMSHDELTAWVSDALGEPAPVANRVFRAIHRAGGRDVATLPGVARSIRGRLARRARLGGLALTETLDDPDGTRKLLFQTADGHAIEAVVLDLGTAEFGSADRGGEEVGGDNDATPEWGAGSGGWAPGSGIGYSLCVSSQVGCNLGCLFCLTGTRRKNRDLTAGEIVDQVAHANRLLAGGAHARSAEMGKAVGNIVFMGMGEPLDNYENVVRALRILQHPEGMDFSNRRLTVSTAGVVPGIRRLAAEPGLIVNLAVSLNATSDETRSALMPVARAWPLAELFDALRAFPVPRRRRLTLEYVLLDGVNDSHRDAERLAALCRGLPVKVNLLFFNPWDGAPFERPGQARVTAFLGWLREQGLKATVRASRGRDVGAACGQLGG